ncbi:hypothetical protein [Streptomyces cellulosae]|uniref:Uncharacterized protein n=1 Tax=Streptomyces cellulosae TaxID=1968 RepID=A0ABW7YBR0_STRCE
MAEVIDLGTYGDAFRGAPAARVEAGEPMRSLLEPGPDPDPAPGPADAHRPRDLPVRW